MTAPLVLDGLTRTLASHDRHISYWDHGKLVSRPFSEMAKDIAERTAWLRSVGVLPGMRLGIRAPNSYLWVVWDLAMLECGVITAAFTDDFAGRPAADLCEEHDLALILVTGAEKKRRIGESPDFVVNLEEIPGDIAIRGGEIRPAGEAHAHPWLIFSSGSAGGIKGMVMRRKGVELAVDAFTRTLGLVPEDTLLLFLPLSNFQQRLMCYAAAHYGINLIVTEPGRLFDTLVAGSPSLLIAPPILYEGVENRFYQLPAAKRAIALGLARAISLLPVPGLRQAARRRLFGALHRQFGGRMRVMITGMAPIRRSALDLFRLAGLSLFETYGLIETGPLALNTPAANRPGSVGRLLPGVAVEFAEDGEIIIRRDEMQADRYFQAAEGENQRTFIGPGRLATGDIGHLDADGFLFLAGRKKEIIVTPGGEKIHPEAIEAAINLCPLVAQSVALWDPEEEGLAVVAVPRDPLRIEHRAEIERFIGAAVARLPSIELSRVLFGDSRFTRESGHLRPNLKLDRPRIAASFLKSAARPADEPRSPAEVEG